MPSRTLRLTKNLVALQPMRRYKSEGGILFDMPRNDDHTQWLVINMSERAWRHNEGHVQNGAHVIIDSRAEHAHTFPDGIIVTDAKHIVAVVGNAGSKAVENNGGRVAH